MFEMDCPFCGKTLQIDDRYAGLMGRCNHCNGEFEAIPDSVEKNRPAGQRASNPATIKEHIGDTLSDLSLGSVISTVSLYAQALLRLGIRKLMRPQSLITVATLAGILATGWYLGSRIEWFSYSDYGSGVTIHCNNVFSTIDFDMPGVNMKGLDRVRANLNRSTSKTVVEEYTRQGGRVSTETTAKPSEFDREFRALLRSSTEASLRRTSAESGGELALSLNQGTRTRKLTFRKKEHTCDVTWNAKDEVTRVRVDGVSIGKRLL